MASHLLDNPRRRLSRRAMRLVYREPTGMLCPPGRLPANDIHRILICRTVRTLGDSLTLTPLLQELESRFPGTEIDVVSRCPVAELIYGRRFAVGAIIRMPVHAARHPFRMLMALKQMRHVRYDLVIDPDPQSQSGRLLTILARTRWSLGFICTHKSGKLTHGVAVAGCPRHKGMAPVFLLRHALGAITRNDDYPRLNIRLSDRERRMGWSALNGLGAGKGAARRHCIGVFADATGAKRFSHDWWNRFLAVFESATSGYALVEFLPATGVSLLDSRYPCFYSSSVRKMAAVMAQLAFFVSADCGVMHLASAAGVPTVGIFSVTDATEWGPYGGQNRAIGASRRDPEEVAGEVMGVLKTFELSPENPTHAQA